MVNKEKNMDLFIETLTGTIFELRVSPFETILSIKSKVQRLEGIPVSQQNLIWQSTQLEDDNCLHDYNIGQGATVKLVLAMRGGPINTRRISLEEPAIREVADLMESNRDEFFEQLMKEDQQLTLLVFRDGDQLNFFRVLGHGDRALSPYSESLSGPSTCNFFGEEDGNSVVSDKKKRLENKVMKSKMKILREQLALKAALKKKETPMEPTPPALGRPTGTLAKRRLSRNPSRHYFTPKTESEMGGLVASELTPSPSKAEAAQFDPDLSGVPSVRRRLLPPVTGNGNCSIELDASEVVSSMSRDSAVSPLLPKRLENASLDECGKARASDSCRQPGVRSEERHFGDILHEMPSCSEATELTAQKSSVSNTEEPEPDSVRGDTVAVPDQLITRWAPLPGLSRESRAYSSRKLLDLERSTKRHSNRHRRHMLKPLSPMDASCASASSPFSKLVNRESVSSLSEDCDGNRGDGDHGDRLATPTVDSIDQILKETHLDDAIGSAVELESYKQLLSWVQPDATFSERLRNGAQHRWRVREDVYSLDFGHSRPSQSRSGIRSPGDRHSVRLRSSKMQDVPGHNVKFPPVCDGPPSLAPSSKRARCLACSKKLGIATSYQCRCSGVFCAKHRYPEAHFCTFDYKTEGRKLLAKNNPLVTAPKLPKI